MPFLQALGHAWRSIKRFLQIRTAEQFTALGTVITGLATFILAGGVWVAYLEYRHKEQAERLQRALSLIEKASTEPAAPAQCCVPAGPDAETEAEWKAVKKRRALVTQFPDRFEGIPPQPLDTADAELLLEISLKRDISTDEEQKRYERWDTARKHLNELEIFAFAYVYDFADRKLLAAAACGRMVRSNAYFKELIGVFGKKFGSAQSWQIIPQAVTMMERDHGSGCEEIYPKPKTAK